MQCPFRYRWRTYGRGAGPDFVFWMMERDRENEREFNAKYPTCWAKFLHWLGT